MRITQILCGKIALRNIERKLDALRPLHDKCVAQLPKLYAGLNANKPSENNGGRSVFSWDSDLDPVKEYENQEALRKAVEPAVIANRAVLRRMMCGEDTKLDTKTEGDKKFIN